MQATQSSVYATEAHPKATHQHGIGSYAVFSTRILCLILLLLVTVSVAIAQDPSTPSDTSRVEQPIVPADSSLSTDTVRTTMRRGTGIDTNVVYNADSIIFDVKNRKWLLFGNAVVINGPQKLSAHYIEIDFDNSILYAEARYDSTTGKYVDVPVFKDVDREFSARTITYSFRTKRGTLSAAETVFDEGFYHGEKIKRVSENTLFVKDGYYTTCDAPTPHYYFSSPEMKVIVGEQVLADVPTLNIEGVPILPIPMGVFFPGRGGRQSGLIIPRWSQNAQRGFTIEGLGYYWTGGPFSDYFDTRLMADLFSKGGFTLRNYSRIRWRGYIDVLDINPTYGQTRDNVDNPLTENIILSVTTQAGQQLIGRKSRLGGYLNFSTSNAIRNTSNGISEFNRLQDITTQQIISNFSYSTSFDWGGQLSVNYDRNENIITNELTETFPSVSLSLPSWTPFASVTGDGGFFETFSVGGSLSGINQFSRRDTISGGGFRFVDTKRSISLSPTIGLSPKFGYFTVQPSFSTSGSILFRRIHKQAFGDTIISTSVPGVFFAGNYSAGLSLATKLYGILQWNGPFDITAIRHVVTPTIGWTYRPGVGKQFYDKFFNPITNRIEEYSVFERDGVAPGNRTSQNISFGLANTFEAKVAQGDTLEDRKIQLLTLNLNTAYDAAPDAEFRWSPLSLSASTDLGVVGRLNANATLDPYGVDTLGIRIPGTLLSRGEGWFRPTSIGFNISTSFSDEGFTTGATAPTVAEDSALARRERFEFHEHEFDQETFFGEHVRGLADFRIPWEVSLSGSYNLSAKATGGFDIYATLNTNFSFSLTPTIKISSGASYDFRAGEFLIPNISFYKDLHCWEMSFDWRPSGFSRGFYFRLNIKSPQLQDIKLERTGFD